MSHSLVEQVYTERYCIQMSKLVKLKTSYYFPSDILPDIPKPNLTRHCTQYFECNLQDKTACKLIII